MVTTGTWLYLAHLAMFAGTAAACFASLGRVRAIDDPESRRGLAALLVTSGAWAVAHLLFLVVPTVGMKLVIYEAGLIIGLSTVGPWLYFCSAFTGRSLHRNRRLRRLAVGVFLVIVAVKLTNPLHGLYFTASPSATPFPHLAVRLGLLHWAVLGLAYALAAVGYFMLLELFLEVGHGTRSLAALVGVTGLPLVLDLAGLTSPLLLPFTYEPVGVAAFAVGVAFVYLDRFREIRLTGTQADAAVVLSENDAIRDFNTAAAELFPRELTLEAVGEPLWNVLPDVAAALADDEPTLAVERGGETRYYRLTTNTFGSGGPGLGRAILLSDVTHRERYRRELERQNDRLEQFASMVSHDLRNPLNVAQGHLETARENHDDGHLAEVAAAHDRMEALIEDLLALARQGQPIDEPEPVALDGVAEAAWGLVDTGDGTLEATTGLVVRADPDRLQQLFENLFRNAVEHGGTDVAVGVGALADEAGFYVEDDGPGIPEDAREEVFESGYTTDAEGTGFGLAIVAEIVDAHGWAIAVTASAEGGARFEVTGVDVDA